MTSPLTDALPDAAPVAWNEDKDWLSVRSRRTCISAADMIHITQRVVLFIHDTILIANNKDGGKPNQMVMLHAYIICIGTWNDIDANSCMHQMQRIYPHTDTHTHGHMYTRMHHTCLERCETMGVCVCLQTTYVRWRFRINYFCSSFLPHSIVQCVHVSEHWWLFA